MSLGFLELINRIEAEIKIEYIGGAIQWCDEKFDGAWSKAMDRFDKALTIAIDRQDYQLAKMEGEFYKATVLDLLSKFNVAKGKDEADTFLKALVPA